MSSFSEDSVRSLEPRPLVVPRERPLLSSWPSIHARPWLWRGLVGLAQSLLSPSPRLFPVAAAQESGRARAAGGAAVDLLVEGGGGGDGRLAGRAGERGSPRGSGAGAASRGGATCPAPPPGSQRPPLTEPFISSPLLSREGGGLFFLKWKMLG